MGSTSTCGPRTLSSATCWLGPMTPEQFDRNSFRAIFLERAPDRTTAASVRDPRTPRCRTTRKTRWPSTSRTPASTTRMRWRLPVRRQWSGDFRWSPASISPARCVKAPTSGGALVTKSCSPAGMPARPIGAGWLSGRAFPPPGSFENLRRSRCSRPWPSAPRALPPRCACSRSRAWSRPRNRRGAGHGCDGRRGQHCDYAARDERVSRCGVDRQAS